MSEVGLRLGDEVLALLALHPCFFFSFPPPPHTPPPQNLPEGAPNVGSLNLTYISKVGPHGCFQGFQASLEKEDSLLFLTDGS